MEKMKDVQNVKPYEESLKNTLIRHGLNPGRIKEFIDNNLDTNRHISELKKDSTSKIDHAHELLIINEVEILRMLLDD